MQHSAVANISAEATFPTSADITYNWAICDKDLDPSTVQQFYLKNPACQTHKRSTTEKNHIIRPFSSGNTSKWYNLQIVDHPKGLWIKWKASLMKVFSRTAHTLHEVSFPNSESREISASQVEKPTFLNFS